MLINVINPSGFSTERIVFCCNTCNWTITRSLNAMLNTSYTLGTTTATLTYVKQYPDANKSAFSVSGLASTAARKLTVSHQPASNGRCRSMIDLTRVDVNPSSAAGSTEQSRLYVVLDRSSFLSEAECQLDRIRLKTLVDDSTFWSALCNREV